MKNTNHINIKDLNLKSLGASELVQIHMQILGGQAATHGFLKMIQESRKSQWFFVRWIAGGYLDRIEKAIESMRDEAYSKLAAEIEAEGLLRLKRMRDEENSGDSEQDAPVVH